MKKESFDISWLNKVITPQQFADKIFNPLNVVAKRTNELFEDECIIGTCYYENVYNVLFKKLGWNNV